MFISELRLPISLTLEFVFKYKPKPIDPNKNKDSNAVRGSTRNKVINIKNKSEPSEARTIKGAIT